MPYDQRYIQKTTERVQGNMNGEVMKCRVQINNKSNGEKRGAYWKRARVAGD